MTSGVASTEVSVRSSPHFAGGGPDADEYGASKDYPIGSSSTFDQIPFLVGSYSHFDRIFEGRLIRRAAAPSRLERASIEPAIRYEFEGRSLTLDDYLARNPVTGLLVARQDHTCGAVSILTARTASPHVVVDGEDDHRDADRRGDRGRPHPLGR